MPFNRQGVEEALDHYLTKPLRVGPSRVTPWKRRKHYLVRGAASSLYFGAGRCLFALGKREDAAARPEEARNVFRRLGAMPLIAEAETWINRART